MISTIPVMIIFFSSLLKIEKTNFYQILGVIFSMLGVSGDCYKSLMKTKLSLIKF